MQQKVGENAGTNNLGKKRSVIDFLMDSDDEDEEETLSLKPAPIKAFVPAEDQKKAPLEKSKSLRQRLDLLNGAAANQDVPPEKPAESHDDFMEILSSGDEQYSSAVTTFQGPKPTIPPSLSAPPIPPLTPDQPQYATGNSVDSGVALKSANSPKPTPPKLRKRTIQEDGIPSPRKSRRTIDSSSGIQLEQDFDSIDMVDPKQDVDDEPPKLTCLSTVDPSMMRPNRDTTQESIVSIQDSRGLANYKRFKKQALPAQDKTKLPKIISNFISSLDVQRPGRLVSSDSDFGIPVQGSQSEFSLIIPGVDTSGTRKRRRMETTTNEDHIEASLLLDEDDGF